MFHQILPLAILLVVGYVWSGVRAILWRHKAAQSNYWSFNILPDESYGDSPPDADEGQSEITGALSGTVVDENNVPVYAIDVTLMPVGGTAPADCYHQDPREMGRRNTR